MNRLLVGRFVAIVEMRNLQGAHRLDRHVERFLGSAATARSQVAPSGPQDPKDLCPVESLPFTMVTETHRRSPWLLVRRFDFQDGPVGRTAGGTELGRDVEVPVGTLLHVTDADVELR